MRITREVDGLKFIGECAPERGFVAGDIQCAHCGRRIDPKTEGRDVSLDCSGCGMRPKVFWSEADMHVFLAENWSLLRQACTHPTVTTLRYS